MLSGRVLGLSATGLALGTGFGFVGVAPGAHLRSGSSSLQLDRVNLMELTGAPCPPNTPAAVICGTYRSAKHPVRGIGSMVLSLEVRIDRTDPTQRCSSWTARGTLAVDRKGTFLLTGSSEGCQPYPDDGPGPKIPFTVTGGEGRFAGASGSGLFDFTYTRMSTPVRMTGTVTVPGFEFDLTPPTISAPNKTIRTRGRARSVRVRYSVTAQDNADGSVAVRCAPASGSRFKVGRTKVRCTAEDSSANDATATFTVTVKHKARRARIVG